MVKYTVCHLSLTCIVPLVTPDLSLFSFTGLDLWGFGVICQGPKICSLCQAWDCRCLSHDHRWDGKCCEWSPESWGLRGESRLPEPHRHGTHIQWRGAHQEPRGRGTGWWDDLCYIVLNNRKRADQDVSGWSNRILTDQSHCSCCSESQKDSSENGGLVLKYCDRFLLNLWKRPAPVYPVNMAVLNSERTRFINSLSCWTFYICKCVFTPSLCLSVYF